MKIAVAGGTGVAGRWTVDALRAGGHEALVIARSAGTDLVTGKGLEAALTGVDAVITGRLVRLRIGQLMGGGRSRACRSAGQARHPLGVR